MIRKPTEPVTIEFESDAGEHKLSAVTLSHLYGEAQTAAKLMGSDRTLTIHDLFRTKIAEQLGIEPGQLSEEVVFHVAQELEAKLATLKKTCVTTAA